MLTMPIYQSDRPREDSALVILVAYTRTEKLRLRLRLRLRLENRDVPDQQPWDPGCPESFRPLLDLEIMLLW